MLNLSLYTWTDSAQTSSFVEGGRFSIGLVAGVGALRRHFYRKNLAC